MKKIVVLTATRAEYGLLKPLIMKLADDPLIDMRLAVTGMHLSVEFGMTVEEIRKDGLKADKKIEILLSSDTPVAVSKSMGLAVISFAEYFDDCRPDALLVLGDRFETLAVCCAAMNARIPVFHLYGGEATGGMVDEAVRHCITKMSYLHFTSTKVYRRRVIQLGESPDRVFYVGAMGVENALHTQLMSREELEQSTGLAPGVVYALGTFHPVTLEDDTAATQTYELLAALEQRREISWLFTKANADAGGRTINRILSHYAASHNNFILSDSLGMTRYLSALKYAAFVIGNSSSGLTEAPSFGIPTINIGDRQKGRVAGETVIMCEPDKDSISLAIKTAMSPQFRMKAEWAVSPYGDGHTSERILEVIREFLSEGRISLKKEFYDIKTGTQDLQTVAERKL